MTVPPLLLIGGYLAAGVLTVRVLRRWFGWFPVDGPDTTLGILGVVACWPLLALAGLVVVPARILRPSP